MGSVHAYGIAQIRFQNPFEHTIGVSGWFVAFDAGPDAAPSVIVEAGERFLYDISDLKTNELRLAWRRGAFGALSSFVTLQSPVGHESALSVEPFARSGAAGLGIELGWHALSLDGFERASTVTAGARARVSLAGSVQLAYAIENVRLFGDELRGADVSFSVFVLRTVSSVVQLRMSRDGAAALSAASWVRFGRLLVLAAGYDDGAEMLKAAAAFAVRRITLGVGASLHPFLGVSESVFLTWRR